MDSLPNRHLTTLSLDVDLAEIVTIGATSAGHRVVAPVGGGRFDGERLSGRVRPGGSDWVTIRGTSHFGIDVRLLLDTDDGATIGLNYAGRFLGEGAAMSKFLKGEAVDPADYSLQAVARFECGDARYAWLNDAIVVAIGEQTPRGPAYQMFEIGR